MSERRYFEQFMGDIIWYTVVVAGAFVWDKTTSLDSAIETLEEARKRDWILKGEHYIKKWLNEDYHGELLGRIE